MSFRNSRVNSTKFNTRSFDCGLITHICHLVPSITFARNLQCTNHISKLASARHILRHILLALNTDFESISTSKQFDFRATANFPASTQQV